MAKRKTPPMRRCVGCMVSKPKGELVRITLVDGKPAVDPTGKANGRGVYLCRDLACFEQAKKRKAISRGLSAEGLNEQDYMALKEQLSVNIGG